MDVGFTLTHRSKQYQIIPDATQRRIDCDMPRAEIHCPIDTSLRQLVDLVGFIEKSIPPDGRGPDFDVRSVG